MRARTFSNEYPPSTVDGSNVMVAATCMWFDGDSRYRKLASSPLSRSISCLGLLLTGSQPPTNVAASPMEFRHDRLTCLYEPGHEAAIRQHARGMAGVHG